MTKCEVQLGSAWGPPKPAILKCIPGWNGGLNQTFILEVLKSRNVYSRPLALVRHSPAPTFSLDTLEPGEEYLLIVSAANAKGSSSPFTLSYRAAPKNPNIIDRINPTSSPDAYASRQSLSLPWGVFAGMLLGVFATVFMCFLVAIYVARRRAEAREGSRNIANSRGLSGRPTIKTASGGGANVASMKRNVLRKEEISVGNLKLTPSPIIGRKCK